MQRNQQTGNKQVNKTICIRIETRRKERKRAGIPLALSPLGTAARMDASTFTDLEASVRELPPVDLDEERRRRAARHFAFRLHEVRK